jgi:hypothetical protein
MRSALHALAIASALGPAGCYLFVVDGAPSAAGSGGAGGAAIATGVGGADATTTPTPTTPPLCPPQCDGPIGTPWCSCLVSCDGLSRVACRPFVDTHGEDRVECVCTIEEVFSGLCVETDPTAYCEPRRGCCRKYWDL